MPSSLDLEMTTASQTGTPPTPGLDEAAQPFAAPQQDRSRKSLRKIVLAAEQVLRQEGPTGFSIARVAAASGMSVGGIYRRVQSKGELLQAIKHEALSRIRFDELEGRAFDSFAGVVGALVDTLVTNYARDEAIHRILFRADVADPVMTRRGAEGRTWLRNRFSTAALPLFRRADKAAAETAVTLGYELVIGAVLNRVRGDPTAARLSWPDFGAQLKIAATAYLEAIEAGGGKTT
jgi:AcrR family transcriptional regulator